MIFYNVFDITDKNSYPIKDEVFLFWEEGKVLPKLGMYTKGQILEINTGKISYPTQFLYTYVGKRPKIVREFNVEKCGSGENGYHCEHFDDGYCMKCNGNCKWKVQRKEYTVE